MSQTAPAPAAPPRSAHAVELTVYKSTAEFMETSSDFLLDSRDRQERGLPARSPALEPAGRSAAVRFSFEPFPGEPDAEPFGLIESANGARLQRDHYGRLHAAGVTSPTSTALTTAAEVVDHAAADRFGLRATGGPLLAEVEARKAAQEAARDARLAELADARDAERDAATREREALRDAAESVPVPSVGSMVLTWHRRDVGGGYYGATSHVYPLPAVVLTAARRSPAGPPLVSVMAFGAATPSGTAVMHDLPYTIPGKFMPFV